MKKLLISVFCCFLSLSLSAQNRNDSLAYELQRKKINSMLAQRAQKFDQYDESLAQHTGIFGMQTKKDIRRSNDILMEITDMDNKIFKELKILLDYRAFEQKQVQSHSADMQNTNQRFMNTINQLRQQNEQLAKDAEDARKEQEKTRNTYLIVIVVLIITSILLLLTRKRTFKA